MIGLVLAAMVGQLTAMDPLDWKPGDRAWIVASIEYKEMVGVPLASDPESYALFGQLVEAKDRDGFDRMEKAKSIFWLGTNAELVVLSFHPDYLPPALECRTSYGRKAWIAEAFVGRTRGRR